MVTALAAITLARSSDFPAPRHSSPTRDEMAAYLQRYAAHFELPVLARTRVDALGRSRNGRFLIAAGERRFEADNVVIATGPFQVAWRPEFADELDPRITQLHSSEYRNPAALPDGEVLVVGAGNSGTDIALELAATRRVSLSGELPPEIPFNIQGVSGRVMFPLLWQVWSHVLSFGTPIGRKVLPKVKAGKEPLIRVKRRHLKARGVQIVRADRGHSRRTTAAGRRDRAGRLLRHLVHRVSRLARVDRSPGTR